MVFSPGARDDIASVLELTTERGAIAVDGFARASARRQRPGLSAGRSRFVLGRVVWCLHDLAGRAPGDITTFSLTDAAGTHLPAAPFALTAATVAGGVLIDGPTVSLNNLTARLRQIRDAFNNAASAATDFRWQASLQGARLVLTPTAGDANSRATAFSTGAVFDLGGANAGLDVGANRNNTRYYSLDNNALGEYQTTVGNNGSDGNTPTPANYDAAYLVLDSQVDLFNLLILPRTTAQDAIGRAHHLWGPASAFCRATARVPARDPPTTRTGWIHRRRAQRPSPICASAWPRLCCACLARSHSGSRLAASSRAILAQRVRSPA